MTVYTIPGQGIRYEENGNHLFIMLVRPPLGTIGSDGKPAGPNDFDVMSVVAANQILAFSLVELEGQVIRCFPMVDIISKMTEVDTTAVPG